ncbi:MAG TPA: alpha/beta hydrolase [Pseudomonas sp.]|nr:alpha/beta hydrolase [Pseudomonas sp.]
MKINTGSRLGLLTLCLSLAGLLPERPAEANQGFPLQQETPYGSDERQRFDVHGAGRGQAAPVILLVHGGGWAHGDKAARALVRNKVARWLPQGLILVSINYRLLPDADPLEQAGDVALALSKAQALAESWGGDPARFILMGHSAGAHLVALLAASPDLALKQGARPWLGTVALDSAAFDVALIMRARHPRLYDRAFGRDPAYWRAASPLQVLTPGGAPLLAVCSSRRDDSCPQARIFAAQAARLDRSVQVLERDLSHRAINQELGLPGDYTERVEAFLRSLDPSLEVLLAEP